MPELDSDVVRHLAELSQIRMSDEEVVALVDELNVIVQAVSRISEIAADDIPPTSHPIPLVNVFRSDESSSAVRLTVEQALSGAPDREGDQFKVAPVGSSDSRSRAG